ncbi:DUF3693 domain-containing protein [Burkholderia contaminans]|uniref:DUF3693 domain-containing protein n=1 Tax=Burkholderia contaminans TaxID=488447 RepID=UPI00174AD57A|nr:DUF3693 domain-containing protein [Burkholderia contaminans]MBD1410261.1 hypothetical protein [Burkholderia contaminans]UXZ70041.1 DUF3693 domain-containing protein [Burkholderia contaminans]UXZ76748.1 DUF3693 domain-containing protein [Burkholderia contaminans]
MKTTAQWLDALKERLGLPSDYAVAKALGVTRGAVSHYRTGRSAFDDVTAVRAAELLGMDPAVMLASVQYERAKNEDVREAWASLLEKFSEGFRTLVLRANACWAWVPQV